MSIHSGARASRRAATLLAVVLLAGAARPASDRTAIEAQANRMYRAFETRQMAVWDEVLSADFRAVTPTRTLDRATSLAAATEEAESALPPVSVDIRRVRIDVNGDSASADARERTCYGVRGTDGARHRLCYRQRFAELWRKESGVWHLAEIRYSPQRSFRIDGKLVTRDEMRRVVGR